MDTRLLKSHMARQGKTGVEMASALGICYGSWVDKSLGRRTFTVEEAIKIMDTLSLSNEQASEVFFARKSDF